MGGDETCAGRPAAAVHGEGCGAPVWLLLLLLQAVRVAAVFDCVPSLAPHCVQAALGDAPQCQPGVVPPLQPALPVPAAPRVASPFQASDSNAQSMQTLRALQAQEQPAQLLPGVPDGTWEQRLRARLAATQDGSGSLALQQPLSSTAALGPLGLPSAPPPAPLAAPGCATLPPLAPTPPAALDSTLSMLLSCFPPPAAGAGGGGSGSDDLVAMLNSAGSAGGDSLLGSLLRAAGGQPGVDDLANMLASL